MLKSIAQVKTFVNEVVNAESTAHILSNRGRNMRPPVNVRDHEIFPFDELVDLFCVPVRYVF